MLKLNIASLVAPFAGAWIEIVEEAAMISIYGSPPSRGRGLKFGCGAFAIILTGRPLRGGVD